eukprot:3941061-Rhodomonas_salina.4
MLCIFRSGNNYAVSGGYDPILAMAQSAELVQMNPGVTAPQMTPTPAPPTTINTQKKEEIEKEPIKRNFDLEHDSWQEKYLQVPVNILYGLYPLTFSAPWDFSLEGYNLCEDRAECPFGRILPRGAEELREKLPVISENMLNCGKSQNISGVGMERLQTAMKAGGLNMVKMRIFKEIKWTAQLSSAVGPITWATTPNIEAEIASALIQPTMVLCHETGPGFLYRCDDGFLCEVFNANLRDKKADWKADWGFHLNSGGTGGKCCSLRSCRPDCPNCPGCGLCWNTVCPCYACCFNCLVCCCQCDVGTAREDKFLKGKPKTIKGAWVIDPPPGWRLTISSMEPLHSFPQARKALNNHEHDDDPSPWVYVLDLALDNVAEDVFNFVASMRADATRQPFAFGGAPQVVTYTDREDLEGIIPDLKPRIVHV